MFVLFRGFFVLFFPFVFLNGSEYAFDRDEHVSRAAVHSIGRIGCKLSEATDIALNTLMDLLEFNAPHLQNEALIALKGIFLSLSCHVLLHVCCYYSSIAF